MRRKIIAAVLGAGLMLASVAAEAGYRQHRYNYGYNYRGHGGHYGYQGGHGGHGALVAAGLLGGALLLGTLLSTPRYNSRPAPAYYRPPPRQPYCVKDKVYRHLPDGQIQWGTRTRCY